MRGVRSGGRGRIGPSTAFPETFLVYPKTLSGPETQRPAAARPRLRRGESAEWGFHPNSPWAGSSRRRFCSFRCNLFRFSPNKASPPSSCAARAVAACRQGSAPTRDRGPRRPPSLSPAPGEPNEATGSLFNSHFVFKSSRRSSPELYTLAPTRGGLSPAEAFMAKVAKTAEIHPDRSCEIRNSLPTPPPSFSHPCSSLSIYPHFPPSHPASAFSIPGPGLMVDLTVRPATSLSMLCGLGRCSPDPRNTLHPASRFSFLPLFPFSTFRDSSVQGSEHPNTPGGDAGQRFSEASRKREASGFRWLQPLLHHPRAPSAPQLNGIILYITYVRICGERAAAYFIQK